MNDPDISDNLRRIVPDDLSSAGLVEGARRKRRRRHGVTAGMAALLLVAVAVPAALNLPDNSQLAQPAATPTIQQDEGGWPVSPRPGAEACYGDNGLPYAGETDDIEPAPTGALRAWLCGDYPTDRGMGYVGPVEPLTTGMDELMRSVQAAPEADLASVICPDDYTLGFSVVFEYEDGSRRVIRGDLGGCRFTYDGEVVRRDADAFHEQAVSAWERQRERDKGLWGTSIFCPGPHSLLPMQIEQTVRIAICAESAVGTRSATYLDDGLERDVLTSIKARLALTGDDTPPPVSTAPQERRWLSLSDSFSGQMTMVRHTDGVYRALEGGGPEWFWAPDEGLSERLDRALSSSTSPEVPPTAYPVNWPVLDPTEEPELPTDPTQPFAPEECRAAADGVTSSALPDGELPQGPERIWLCAAGEFTSGVAAPLEPLEEPDLIARATEAFNELAPMPRNQPCTDDLGPTYQVVHEYADGARYTIEYQQYGCGPVTAGDVVKQGPYLPQLLDLWETQRGDRPVVQTRPGPLCQLFSSVLDVDPRATPFVSGVACTASDDAGGAALEQPLSDDLVSAVSAGMRDESTVVGQHPLDGRHSIVLLNPAGDPFRMSRVENGGFTWWEGDTIMVWSPTGETAQALATLFED